MANKVENKNSVSPHDLFNCDVDCPGMALLFSVQFDWLRYPGIHGCTNMDIEAPNDTTKMIS